MKIVPKDAHLQSSALVLVARKYDFAIAECYWNGNEVTLDVEGKGKEKTRDKPKIENPLEDDNTLVLRTSGTIGRSKGVCMARYLLLVLYANHPGSH